MLDWDKCLVDEKVLDFKFIQSQFFYLENEKYFETSSSFPLFNNL